MTELRVTVKIDGAGTTFPAQSGWYNNQKPNIQALGGDYFELNWPVNVQPGGSVHVGVTFTECHDITLIHGRFWGPVGPVHWAGATMRHRNDPQLGLVVDLSNESDTGDPVTLTALQWTLYSEHVALNNLDWEDPVLSLLDWQDITPDLPLELFAGEVQTFDVPDDALSEGTYALVRWIASDGDGEVIQQPVVELAVDQLIMPVVEPPGIPVLEATKRSP